MFVVWLRLTEEKIARLERTVDNLTVMELLETLAHLHKEVPYQLFR